MKVLFVHQNCPGQFKHLASAMAAEGHEVVFVSQKNKPTPKGVRKFEYAPHRKVTPGIHPYLVGTEAAVLNGQAVARLGFQLRERGFRPDVMIGNPGWGETLFLKDVWPQGMKAHLAFAVSMGIDFDTYLIDEVTSVGDESFREKSEAMLQDRLQTRGAVVVSHNGALLRRLCDAAVVIENGQATWFDSVGDALKLHRQNMDLAPEPA